MTALVCSTITLTAAAIPVAQDDLTIVGPGRDLLTIDAGGTSRIFELNGKYESENPNQGIYVTGLTITNGYGMNVGGCITGEPNIALANVTLSNCRVKATGTTQAGGGAVNSWGNVFIVNSTLSGNLAQAEDGEAKGGAIYAVKYAEVLDSVLVGNKVESQNGIASGGAISAERARFSGGGLAINQAGSYTNIARGGAIFVSGSESMRPLGGPTSGSAVVEYATLLQNRAISLADSAYGGALHVGSATVSPVKMGIAGLIASNVINNVAYSQCASCSVTGGAASAVGAVTSYYSTIVQNVAGVIAGSTGSAYGGGLAVMVETPAYSGQLVIFQSTLTGNTATASDGLAVGGATVSSSGPTTVSFSTISGNTSTEYGGGMAFNANGDFEVRLENTIVAGNEAPQGPDLVAPSSTPAAIDGDHNLVLEVANVSMPADTLYTDPKLASLDDNGGPTLTIALLPDSPAIDAGSIMALRPSVLPVLAPLLPTGFFPYFDQRGNPYARVWGEASDIGAFELQPNMRIIFEDEFE